MMCCLWRNKDNNSIFTYLLTVDSARRWRRVVQTRTVYRL